jgi:hypothetical protein
MGCIYLVMGNVGYDRRHFYFAFSRDITEFFISLPIKIFPSIWAQPTMVSTGNYVPLCPFQSMARVNPVMGDAAYNLCNLI